VAVVFKENGHDDPKRNVAHLLRCQLRLRSKKKGQSKRSTTKNLFPFAFSASSFPQNPQNFAKQWANLQELPTSG
jgi:hypothetical protein